MFQLFLGEKVITICMISSLFLSVFTKIIIGILYQNMIKETENMASTNHKKLKQCKLKFANCYQLNGGMSNVPIFVDKFLNKLKIGPLSFHTIYHLSGQFMLLSVVFSGIGICKSIIGGYSLGAILPFYIFSFLGLYLYFAVSAISDVRGRRRVLKTNLVDYLENHYASRLEIEEEKEVKEIKEPIQVMPFHTIVPIDVKEEELDQLTVSPKTTKSSIKSNEESELEALLREFLTS